MTKIEQKPSPELSLSPEKLENNDTETTKTVVKVNDPTELLTNLKEQEGLLKYLMEHGHNRKDIKKLSASLKATVDELTELLNSPEIDQLSKEV